MDYKLESLKARKQLASIVLKDHGEGCLCSECEIAKKEVFNFQEYERLKAKIDKIQ